MMSYENNKRKDFSIFRFIFSPAFIIVVLLIIELILIFYLFDWFLSTHSYIIVIFINIFSTILIINSKSIKDSYKITWMLLFTFLPVFGVMFYLFIRLVETLSPDKNRLRDVVLQSKKYYVNSCKDEILNDFINIDTENLPEKYDEAKYHIINEISFMKYFTNFAEFPPYHNTALHYFDNGADAFDDILEKMRNAKKFIFIEVFILNDGIVWKKFLRVLIDKAKEGVEIKLMFDGFNGLASFNKKYCNYLKKFNIQAKIFKPFKPIISNSQNNRDHRKIFIVDNEFAYTGGINISDEYANLFEKYGKWKDSAIRLEGNAVESFTIMFLHLWNVDEKKVEVEFEKYLPIYDKKIENYDEYNFTVPYSDYPKFSENISMQILKYIFNSSKEYIYIMTPYLVIDEAMVDTLEAQAKRGVDVRIVVPHIQDKKYVFMVNRSFYRRLTNAGVKVYEYIPGFIHSKVYLQDDTRAIVGTCNLDFRSLYLHYENGVYVFGNKKLLSDIKNDFMKTLDACREMDHVEIGKMPISHKIFGALLKMFAPFM